MKAVAFVRLSGIRGDAIRLGHRISIGSSPGPRRHRRGGILLSAVAGKGCERLDVRMGESSGFEYRKVGFIGMEIKHRAQGTYLH